MIANGPRWAVAISPCLMIWHRLWSFLLLPPSGDHRSESKVFLLMHLMSCSHDSVPPRQPPSVSLGQRLLARSVIFFRACLRLPARMFLAFLRTLCACGNSSKGLLLLFACILCARFSVVSHVLFTVQGASLLRTLANALQLDFSGCLALLFPEKARVTQVDPLTGTTTYFDYYKVEDVNARVAQHASDNGISISSTVIHQATTKRWVNQFHAPVQRGSVAAKLYGNGPRKLHPCEVR